MSQLQNNLPIPGGSKDSKTQFVNCREKEIFGQEGDPLAAFDSSQQSGSSSLSLGIVTEPMGKDDENKTQGCTSNKFKGPTIKDDGCTNQAKRSKVETSENQNVVLQNPGSSRSPEENVFSIDHILESILLECDRQTVLNCRLVSHRWGYFGSKVLQKIVSFSFVLLRDDDETPTFWFQRDKNRSIEDLIHLMNNSSEFPSASFSFCNRSRSKFQNKFQTFLDTHGPLIKKLRIVGSFNIDDLKKLLLTQALNLEHLILIKSHIWFTKRGFSGGGNKHSGNAISLFDKTINELKPTLKNLKVFNCKSEFEEICIQQILDCAPNLREVQLLIEYLPCLVKPVNRFYLVKKLVIDCLQDFNIEYLEVIANQHPDNWAVQELILTGASSHDDDDHFKVVKIMSKIVKSCSPTCQKLVWDGVVENIEFPKMSRVKDLWFRYCEDHDTGLPIDFFREGTSLGGTFPNLKSLKISSGNDMPGVPIENIFGDDDPLPVPGVRDAFLKFIPDKNLFRSFRKMFPNATIHTKPDDEDSDEDDYEVEMK